MGLILLTTLSTLWPLLALVAALAVLGVVLRHSRVKGWWGERRVRRMIREGLNPHLYVDLHNLTLPTADGSTQIDHLIFSPYGVFVLETKNIKGWIFGSESQAEWTQKIHKNHSQKFQNPLRQNYKHTQAVCALLQLPAEQVHSVVAFVGESQFKTDMPLHVLQGPAFISYIQQFQQQIWGPQEMQLLIDRVEQHRLLPLRATHKAHVAHVQQLRADKAQQASTAARRAAPTPQQMAVAPVLQEVVAPAIDGADLDGACVHQDGAAMASDGGGSVSQNGEVLPVLHQDQHSAFGADAAPALLADSGTAAAPSFLPPQTGPEDAAPRKRAVRTCPQCQSALARMRLQRGPLAGQVIYRCSNTALCQYVQPLPASVAEQAGA